MEYARCTNYVWKVLEQAKLLHGSGNLKEVVKGSPEGTLWAMELSLFFFNIIFYLFGCTGS